MKGGRGGREGSRGREASVGNGHPPGKFQDVRKCSLEGAGARKCSSVGNWLETLTSLTSLFDCVFGCSLEV